MTMENTSKENTTMISYRELDQIFNNNANQYGTVQVGYAFECEKLNGKTYSGSIVKVAAYNKGTLVTITYSGEDGPEYRSVYLEDCKVWYSLDMSEYYSLSPA
jgi:hypothetical protein